MHKQKNVCTTFCQFFFVNGKMYLKNSAETFSVSSLRPFVEFDCFVSIPCNLVTHNNTYQNCIFG